MFGSCICFQLIDYSLNAQCTADSKLLKIESATLKELMDRDLLLGYTIQTQVSRIYFNRYIDTMKKLQSSSSTFRWRRSTERRQVPVGV